MDYRFIRYEFIKLLKPYFLNKDILTITIESIFIFVYVIIIQIIF